MAKAKMAEDFQKELLTKFFEGHETDEYIIGEATNILGTLGREAKVDMIAAGAVMMMDRLAKTHGVHILDCYFALPKWISLLVVTDVAGKVMAEQAAEKNGVDNSGGGSSD